MGNLKWSKVAWKVVKHGVITALSGAVVAIRNTPEGQAVDPGAVLSSALLALVAGGGIGGGMNYLKHRKD